MIRPRLPLLAAFLLTACGPDGEEPAAEPEQRTSASPAAVAPPDTFDPAPVPTPESLAGEYRVAGIDGEELDAPIGIAVSISDTTIELEPCAGYAWTYTFQSGRLQTKRIPVSAEHASCEVVSEVARVGVALAEATSVSRTAANGLDFRGGGRSVLLFSQ